MNKIDYAKERILNADVVASETIRTMLKDKEIELSDTEIKSLLEWSGDDEYVSVSDVRENKETAR